MTATKTIPFAPFSEKQKLYMAQCLKSENNCAEGAIRSSKTIMHCLVAYVYLETCIEKIHLASGSTVANAKMNIGDCNGFGLEHLFRGRSHWGEYKNNDALYINTRTGEKVVIFVGGGKRDSYKKILGNSYGLWIATEINLHYDAEDSETSFIKVAMGRQIASANYKRLWDLNPSSPNHKIYSEYIDKWRKSGILNYGHFTLEDNLSITAERKEQIKAQYDVNSIWYKRDILGLRVIAEGLIYEMVANNPKEYEISEDKVPPLIKIVSGIDFGGTSSAQAFVAVGFTANFSDVIILKSERIIAPLNSNQLNSRFVIFAHSVYNKYARSFTCYYDNAEPVLGRSIGEAIRKEQVHCIVSQALKSSILQRIRLGCLLLDQHRLWFVRGQAETVKNAFMNAVWDSKHPDTRLDDGTTDIDSLDATEYCIEREYGNLRTRTESIIYKKE